MNEHVEVINMAGSCVIKQKQNQPMAQAHISKYWCNPGSVWDDATGCQEGALTALRVNCELKIDILLDRGNVDKYDSVSRFLLLHFRTKSCIRRKEFEENVDTFDPLQKHNCEVQLSYDPRSVNRRKGVCDL